MEPIPLKKLSLREKLYLSLAVSLALSSVPCSGYMYKEENEIVVYLSRDRSRRIHFFSYSLESGKRRVVYIASVGLSERFMQEFFRALSHVAGRKPYPMFLADGEDPAYTPAISSGFSYNPSLV